MKRNFPLLVAPSRHADLTGVLGNVHAPYLEEALDDLAEAVSTAIGRKPALASWSKAKTKFLERWPQLRQKVKDRAQVSQEEDDRVLSRVADLEGRLGAAEDTLRVATQLGEKYNYFLAILPELIRGVNSVFLAPDDYALWSAVSELEYMTCFHAAHLYNRHGLRAVIWREENGHLQRGKFVGPWAGGQPELDPLRKDRLCKGPLQQGEDVWVDDPAAAEHAETAELGPGDKGYPSFLLASMLAGPRNYGLLQLEASSIPPRNWIGRCSISGGIPSCGLPGLSQSWVAPWMAIAYPSGSWKTKVRPNGVSNGSVRIGTPWVLSWSCSAWASSARSDSNTPSPAGPASRSVPGSGSRTANGMGEVWNATTLGGDPAMGCRPSSRW